jgi:transcriptional regulator with XRE-family HTH domain
VVQYSDLENNNIDTYAEIIAHLNQAGLNVPLDYDKIKQFFEQIKISNKINYKDFEISNQIKKIIERDCKEMMKKFNYLS